jgi:hypothetical protein
MLPADKELLVQQHGYTGQCRADNLLWSTALQLDVHALEGLDNGALAVVVSQ